MSYPLTGVKVLDLSRVLAGPFAGRMLSDLGADVVKLELARRRRYPPLGELSAGASRYYHQQNAGKRNIAVDLRHPKGLMITRSLVEQADVLIETFDRT